VVGAALSSTLLAEAVEGFYWECWSGDNDVTCGREGDGRNSVCRQDE
jgi:hypothetical protein